MTIWTLVTVDDLQIVTTIHGSEASAYETLRANFLLEDFEPYEIPTNAQIAQAMDDANPDVIWAIESHEFDSGWGV